MSEASTTWFSTYHLHYKKNEKDRIYIQPFFSAATLKDDITTLYPI